MYVNPVRHITVDAHDTLALARFWAELTGYAVEDGSDADEALLNAPESGLPGLLFIRVPGEKVGEPRTGRRIHLDIMPTSRTRDEEIERLKGLGASEYEDHRKPDGTGWMTMADPEGNLFCVERSAAERA